MRRRNGKAAKLLVVLLAACWLAACGGKTDDDKETTQPGDVSGETATGDVLEEVADDVSAETTGDPCQPNPCDQPPAAACSEGTQVLTTYADTGTCTVGDDGAAKCAYEETTTDCLVDDMVCVVDECVDPCTGDPCTDPPADYCDDNGMTLVTYDATGTCSISEHGLIECDYGENQTNCDNEDKVCMEAQCVDADHPCDPNPCTNPPADECAENLLTTYAAEGTCVPGEDDIECEYEKTDTNCEDDGKICFEAECIVDPCEPNPCAVKPVSYCEDDGMTLVMYVGDDTCSVDEQGVAQCNWQETSLDCNQQGKACLDDECIKLGCETHCDCQQGMKCIAEECVLDLPLQFCCETDGCPFGEVCKAADGTDGVCGTEPGDLVGKIVFNEVLTDGSTDQDPNGEDDSGDSLDDEFVELVNVSDQDIDMGGFTIVEETLPTVPRHTFAPGTTLAAGKALVVFGGGDAPDAIPGCMYFTANAEDPGLPFGLSLNNDADLVKLLDADEKLVAEFNYGPGQPILPASDESLTRSPDLTGDFTAHSTADGAGGAIFSPCTKINGDNF